MLTTKELSDAGIIRIIMPETPRKYCRGGSELPLSVEFPKLSGNQFVRVVEAKGRFVKRFQSANMARAFAARHNTPNAALCDPAGNGDGAQKDQPK